MIKQSIAKILDTEMERKDFLKMIGLGVVAAVGVTQIIKALSQPQLQPQRRASKAENYGAMTYGGK